MRDKIRPVRHVGATMFATTVPLLLWAASPGWRVRIDPPLFLVLHAAIELVSIAISLAICFTGYSAVMSGRLRGVVLLGAVFLGVGVLDFLHLVSLAGRPGTWSPAMSHESFLGVGLPPFAIGIDWLAVGINVVTLAVLWRRRARMSAQAAQALVLAVALSAVAELFVTQLGPFGRDEADLLGHLLTAAAYLYLFRAVLDEAILTPVQQIEAPNLREEVTLGATADGVLWIDPQGRILMANPAMERLSGHVAASLVGRHVDIFLPPARRTLHAGLLQRYLSKPQALPACMADVELQRSDDTSVPVEVFLGHWEDRGVRYTVAHVRDLTERRRHEQSQRQQATRDDLTGLPNRWLFMFQLNIALAHARRTGTHVAVMFLDLDYFKAVNDSFGHALGDELLREVGQRIRSVLRETDTVARMGGDEFAFLLTELESGDRAIAVAKKLLSALEASYLIKDRELHSGGSLGIAIFPDDAGDSDTLLRYADIAMYQAKEAGRGGYACYSREMDRRSQEDMQLHVRLKEAIANGSMRLHYQPQYDVNTDAILGAEALLRWHDPVLGHVSPGRFIPIAEASGLIVPLSDWVLEAACMQAAQWARQGTPVVVAINISMQQFRQSSLPARVEALLERTGASARLIEFEITESVAMTHPQQAREQIDALVALGCRVSLDDFGTGYSSLSYLKALKVGTLKIDKSFMDGIPEDASDATICRAIIGLAHSLGMRVVAEGVEKPQQLEFLRLHGCELFQGWLRAPAMSADELAPLLESSACLREAGGEPGGAARALHPDVASRDCA